MTTLHAGDLLGLNPDLPAEVQAQARFARLQRDRDLVPALGEAALSGLAGRIVTAKAPDTEATPAAMLITVLTSFAAMAGRGSWVMVGEQPHYPCLFSTVVGRSARDRKGVSLASVKPVLVAADDPDTPFFAKRVSRGVASGEALIQEVVVASKNGAPPGSPDADADQRLLLIESEYGRLLTVAARDGSTLSMVLRSAWDSDPLTNNTKAARLGAENAHVCIIGHITQDELKRKLRAGEEANGYANRFLYMLSCRTQYIPEPGRFSGDDLDGFAKELAAAVEYAQSAGEIRRSPAFRRAWERVYQVLEQPGGGYMFGNLSARSTAHVLRLSLVYALLDRSPVLDVSHLKAALAVWEYSEATLAYIWGASLGNDRLDRLMEALRKHPDGLSLSAIHRTVFSNNGESSDVQAAVDGLVGMGLARTEVHKPPRGRPSTRVYATE